MTTSITNGGHLERYHTPVVMEGAGWPRPLKPDDGTLPQYLVSDELGEIARFLSISPDHPNVIGETELDEVRSIIGKGLIHTIQESHLHYITVEGMQKDLRAKALELQKQSGALIVTMDNHYLKPDPEHDIHSMQITRMYDEVTGHKIGRGQRPRFLGIEKQIEHLAKVANGKPIILTESGVVTGHTIKLVIDMFQSKGVDVKALCIGIGMDDAMSKLLDWYPQLTIEALVSLRNYTDWTEARDFLAFVPDSGQTVGRKSRVDPNQNVPLFHPRLYCGYTIPYPLGRENRWATLTDRGTAIMRVAGLRATKALFQGIEIANGNKPYTFQDIVKIGKRVDHNVKTTMPWMLAGYGGVGRQIEPESRIVDVLNRLLENVYRLEDGTEILLPESVTAISLYPGGNETILVTTPVDRIAYPEVAKRLLQTHSIAEQVGFVENLGDPDPKKKVRLNMAGGEFCGNATRSMVWYLHQNFPIFRRPDGTYLVNVSGVTRPLEAKVSANNYVTLEMPILENLNSVTKIENTDAYLVRIEGITHIVVFSKDLASQNPDAADALLSHYGLKDEAAAGVIYVNYKEIEGEKDPIMAINPFVYVRDVSTLYNETACASGTTAVGLTLAKFYNRNIDTSILQPSGDLLEIQVEIGSDKFGKATISGPVTFIGKENAIIKQ